MEEDAGFLPIVLPREGKVLEFAASVADRSWTVDSTTIGPERATYVLIFPRVPSNCASEPRPE